MTLLKLQTILFNLSAYILYCLKTLGHLGGQTFYFLLKEPSLQLQVEMAQTKKRRLGQSPSQPEGVDLHEPSELDV